MSFHLTAIRRDITPRIITPLPYISFAWLAGFVALYHFGIYVDRQLMERFVVEYPRHASMELDMDKSCIRFRKLEQIPIALIAEMVAKLNVQEWLSSYVRALQR